MRRTLILVGALAMAIAASAQGVIHGSGDPRTLIPAPNCGNSRLYVDDSTSQLYIAASGSPCVWAPPAAYLPGVTSLATGLIMANSFSGPVYAPTVYIHYGDSLSACSNGLTYPPDCFVNRFGNDLNVAPTNRATSGDWAEDVAWRMQSSDSPTVTAPPNLDTMTIGTNNANINGVSTLWESNFRLSHTAALIWLGLPSGKTAGSTAATTGTCATDTTFQFVTGEQCTANGSTLIFSSITTTGKPVYILYRVISSDAGTWTYNIDGTGAVAVATAPAINFTTSNGHTSTMGYIRIANVAAGSHSIVFTQTHSGTMSVEAIASMQNLLYSALPHMIVMDVPNQKDQNVLAATTAYSVDVATDVQLLANDGFNVVLAPVSTTLQATTAAGDMFDALHPNDAGHIEMYESIRAPSDTVPANPLPFTFSQGATPTVALAASTFQITAANTAASFFLISSLNSASGNADGVFSRGNSGAVADLQFQTNSANGFRIGSIQDSNMDLYDNQNGNKVLSLPLNTMPANSYSGDASGPILLKVRTPAARKGTFVCTAGGTITISNTNETATSDVVISLNVAGGTIATPPAMKTVTAATGFTVLCAAADTSTYNYNVLN